MDFGPDGMLYGPVYTKGIVVRIDPATGETTTVADGFQSRLHAVKFDGQGRIHVLESHPGRLLRVDLDTGDKTVLAIYEPGFDNLAFDSTDRIFVSCHVDGSVHEVMPGGVLRELRAPSSLSTTVVIASLVVPVLLVILLVVALVVTLLRRRRRAGAPSRR